MPIVHYASNTNVLKPDIRTGLFKFCFFAVKRSDPQAKAERKEVYATDLKSAKLQLVSEYVLSLSSQIPVGAVTCHTKIN
ncbi:host cell division inhibitor Icd-like protein [Providencia rettgeri]|uniref:host cell division inhibitor Icd-like protein n=1 Tax=Providencia rettgeri TaxID=587 RepID=UPI001BA71692|nr:host cell division inhibitor Icd-like protein [Providencia rettgeri]MBS0858799.1 host cell division inhibitor Icd-like protein [Providencia rettgeri]MBS0872537.1 host cell division inhibitor Icd-like protein [Providencia rettgeri]MBS0919683.1 host cell division inhibitor Icd-like protein [Providencia rettgeri]MCL0015897.1 host cell division inhibitor Icd-like protein [Providencia rettgeri]